MSATRRRVLIVEDSPAIAGMLAEYFGREGYDAEVAVTADGALESLNRRPADLVLLDLVMPGELTGIDAVRVISKLAPVVVMTGLGNEDAAREALSAGAKAYLAKPFDLGEVRALIRTM